MNATTRWGWLPAPDPGIWRYGASWMRALALVAPWVTFLLLAGLMALASGRFTQAAGTLFDLPEGPAREGVYTPLAAVVMRLAPETGSAEETYVFFEDSRYTLSDPASAAQFAAAVGERRPSASPLSVTLLVDVGVPSGDLLSLASLLRQAGVSRVVCAEKKVRE